MRHLQAALFGLILVALAMPLAGLFYGLAGTTPFTANEGIALISIALGGWHLYLVPALALGIGARGLLRRFGALLGTLLTTVLATLCGAAVGFLYAWGTTHVMLPRAVVCVASAWGLVALILLALVSRRAASTAPA